MNPTPQELEALAAMTSATRKMLKRMLTLIEAGQTPSIAVETSLYEHDAAYRKFRDGQGAPQVNTMLDPVSVELQARFALDALFGALKGGPDEGLARKAFWQVFRRATLPSLTPIVQT